MVGSSWLFAKISTISTSRWCCLARENDCSREKHQQIPPLHCCNPAWLYPCHIPVCSPGPGWSYQTTSHRLTKKANPLHYQIKSVDIEGQCFGHHAPLLVLSHSQHLSGDHPKRMQDHLPSQQCPILSQTALAKAAPCTHLISKLLEFHSGCEEITEGKILQTAAFAF